jgi:hypothetical protein
VHLYERPRYTTIEANIHTLIYARHLQQSLQRLRYGLQDPRLEAGSGKKLVSSPETSRPSWGPPSFPFSWFWLSFPEVKQPGHDVDHSPPSSDEVKNEWSYISTPPIRLHGEIRDKFTFFLTHKAGVINKGLQGR